MFVAACDDPVTPVADDGKVRAVLSAGCRAEAKGTVKGFQSQTKVVVKGVDRTYDWLIPDGHDGTHPVPLVFVYHGGGGTGADVRGSLKLEDATGGKAIMVYPDAALPSKEWDLERDGSTNADMFFFDQIVQTLEDEYCIDTARVFVAGVSNGAYFANQLGCFRGGSIRGISSVSGGGPSGPAQDYDENGKLVCSQKPVGAIIIHGAADTEVALTEGQASRDHWTSVNGCRSGGLETFPPDPCKSQLNCAKDRPVVWCEIPGLGHTIWDQSARASWNFFSAF